MESAPVPDALSKPSLIESLRLKLSARLLARVLRLAPDAALLARMGLIQLRLGRIEEAAIIDGHPISERGIIRPVSDPGQRPQWPETIYLRQNHGGLCYTLESASTEAIEDRIEMHCAVIRSALEVFTRRCQRRRREP